MDVSSSSVTSASTQTGTMKKAQEQDQQTLKLVEETVKQQQKMQEQTQVQNTQTAQKTGMGSALDLMS
jgi:stress response protein YsnF